MHTIKPTTLPFNPEHHIALEVEITYPVDFIARDGFNIIRSRYDFQKHQVTLIKGDMYFLFEGMGPDNGCSIQGIPDTEKCILTGILNEPADDKGVVRAKAEYLFKEAKQVKTNEPADWEKWYVTGG